MACGSAMYIREVSDWMDALLNVGLSPLVPKTIEK